MADIETRLRADAARRAPLDPPSLDAALDDVTVTHPARRARPVALLAAAAVVLLVAGLAAVLTSRSSQHTPVPAGPSKHLKHPKQLHRTNQSRPAQRPQEVLRPVRDYGAAGVLAVPGQPTAYDVIVPFEPDNHPDKCGFYDPTVTIEEQSATAVRLRVSGKVYEQKLDNGKYRSFGCSGGQWKRLRVTLNAPIGDRVLYDSAHGRDFVADPIDYPDFGWVPPGFVRNAGHRPGAAVDTSNGERDYTGRLRQKCSQGTVRGHPLPKKPCTAVLTLRIGPGLPLSWLGGHRTKVSVNGYRATLSASTAHNPDHACVTWQEAPSAHGRQVCIYGDAHVNIPDLLRAARSVH